MGRRRQPSATRSVGLPLDPWPDLTCRPDVGRPPANPILVPPYPRQSTVTGVGGTSAKVRPARPIFFRVFRKSCRKMKRRCSLLLPPSHGLRAFSAVAAPRCAAHCTDGYTGSRLVDVFHAPNARPPRRFAATRHGRSVGGRLGRAGPDADRASLPAGPQGFPHGRSRKSPSTLSCIPSFCWASDHPEDLSIHPLFVPISVLPNVSINGPIRSSGQLGRWWYSINPCRNNECVRRFTVFAFNQRSYPIRSPAAPSNDSTAIANALSTFSLRWAFETGGSALSPSEKKSFRRLCETDSFAWTESDTRVKVGRDPLADQVSEADVTRVHGRSMRRALSRDRATDRNRAALAAAVSPCHRDDYGFTGRGCPVGGQPTTGRVATVS